MAFFMHFSLSTMKKLYLIVSLLIAASVANGQDRIYKKDKEVIEAGISEVGTAEIKYKIFSDPNGPVYTLEKDRILKVVYENGRTETFKNRLQDPELYADQAKNAVKVNFLSPLLGYTQLNWEHSLRPGRSFELSLGIIGLGKRQETSSFTNFDSNTNTYTTYYREARGAFLSGGFKFAKRPDYSLAGAKLNHLFQGFYAKPELSLGVYGQNQLTREFNSNVIHQERKTVVFSGLMVNLGKQWVLGDAFLIDIYAGLGYALDNINHNQYGQGEGYYYGDDSGNHYILHTNNDSGLGISGGIKLGLLIK